MKYLRITSRPDPDVAPPAFRLLTDSPYVREARMVAWNPVDSRGMTALLVVDGDLGAIQSGLGSHRGFADIDVVAAGDGQFYLLATTDPDRMPLARPVYETLTRDGLVVVKPVVYRDGAAHVRIVGETEAVGAAVDALPAAIDVTVHEVGDGGVDPGSATTALSDRQRETMRTAVEMGYYDTPRGATHEEIARRLECSPSTVSEHLQKGEAKLVSNAMAAATPGDVFDRPGRETRTR